MHASWRGCLAGDLGDFDDHELRGLQRCEGDYDVDDAVLLIVGCGGGGVALHLKGIARLFTLQRTLVKQAKQAHSIELRMASQSGSSFGSKTT